MTAAGGEPEPAVSTPEVVKRHCRAISAALTVLEREHPGGYALVSQARGGIEVVLVALAELRYFTKEE